MRLRGLYPLSRLAGKEKAFFANMITITGEGDQFVRANVQAMWR
jgi:hypothetical protein